MFGSWGALSKDVWTIIGDHSTVLGKIKIASTCSKLRLLFYNRFNLEQWSFKLNRWSKKISKANLKKGFKQAIYQRDRELVDLFISKQGSAINWNDALLIAAKAGHRDLVELFISRGAHCWSSRLLEAAAQSNTNAIVRRELIDYFIEQGYNINWDYGLRGAARGGYRDLIDFFISKGADYWHGAIQDAARGGHLDLVDFFIEKGDAGDLNPALYSAARGGHRDLVDYFISKQKSTGIETNWYWILYAASRGGHLEIAEMIMTPLYLKSVTLREYVRCFVLAAKYGHFEIIKLFISFKLISIPENVWDEACSSASHTEQTDMVRFLISEKSRYTFHASNTLNSKAQSLKRFLTPRDH